MIYNCDAHDLSNHEDSIQSVKALNKEAKAKSDYIWGHDRRGKYHPVNDVWTWDRIKKLLAKFVGKPFDDAFSYYCRQVPKYQQHIFLEYFTPSHSRYRNTFYVDDDGLIQKDLDTWKKSKKVIYYSDDYKTEIRHKVTGKSKPDNWWDQPFTENNYREKYPKAKSYYEAQALFDNEFEPIIISGWVKEFDSKKDPEYKRLMSEKRKRHEKARKESVKAEKSKQYSFTHETFGEKILAKRENLLKIKRKGFDPNTSFHKDPE